MCKKWEEKKILWHVAMKKSDFLLCPRKHKQIRIILTVSNWQKFALKHAQVVLNRNGLFGEASKPFG